MRPATKIVCRLLTGRLLTISPSITFAQTPTNYGKTIFVVYLDNQRFTSVANPSNFLHLIDTGKHPSAEFVHKNTDMHLSLMANKDPFISYQMDVTNNSLDNQFYMIGVEMDIAPLGTHNLFQNDLTVTTSGTGSISLFPTDDGVKLSSGLQRELMSLDGGATFNTADEFGPLGTTITTGGTTVSPTFMQEYTNTLAYNYMELRVGFNLSAGTTATLVGSETITPIPEPSTALMAFSAVIMLVAYNIRSHIKLRHQNGVYSN